MQEGIGGKQENQPGVCADVRIVKNVFFGGRNMGFGLLYIRLHPPPGTPDTKNIHNPCACNASLCAPTPPPLSLKYKVKDPWTTPPPGAPTHRPRAPREKSEKWKAKLRAPPAPLRNTVEIDSHCCKQKCPMRPTPLPLPGPRS